MTLSKRVTEEVIYHNEYALEEAAEKGAYQVRVLNGRTITFFDQGGELVGKCTAEQADYLQRIPGFEIVGRDPYPHAGHKPPVKDWMEEGIRLREEREHGKQQQQAAAGGSENALVQALVQALGGPEALMALLLPQVKPDLVNAAVQAQETKAKEEAEKEEERNWRYRDVAGKIDPEDALELLRDYVTDVDLGSMSDPALLKMLADKANVFPGLEQSVLELLNAAEEE